MKNKKNTFNKIYSTRIDSVLIDTEFIVGKSKNNKMGFESYLSTKNLSEGKHILKVNRMVIKKKDTSYIRVATIPFWYFKD